MFYIIVASILLLIAAATAGIGFISPPVVQPEPDRYGQVDRARPTLRRPMFIATAVILGLFLLFTLISSVTVVDARAVAIQTKFNRFHDTLGPGAQFIAPWTSTEEFTTRLKDVDLNDKDGNDKGGAVLVSFSAPKTVGQKTDVAGGGNGRVSAIVRVQINEKSDEDNGAAEPVVKLWRDFKTFDEVMDRLVTSESQQAITDVANDMTAGIASVNQVDIGDKVKASLEQRLAPYGISVDSVAIKGVDLDDPTKASLQRIVDNINLTTAATEEQNRARIDNETARLRTESGALSEKANTRYCLDIANKWSVAQNGPLPATFNCGLGSTDTPVIVGK